MKERFGNILNTKKRKAGVISFVVLLLCAGIAGGLVACSTKAAVPTQDEVVELLQKAEAVYQLGNQDVLTIAQFEQQPSDDQLYYDEISNYEQAVAEIFTENGIAQLEQSNNLGIPLILKQDGKVYRASAMADSAATVFYGTVKSVKLLEEKDEHYVYEIIHIAEPRGFDPAAADTAPELTDRVVLMKRDGLLLVEDFSYPLNITDEDPGETTADEFAVQNAALQERYQRLLGEDNFALLKLLNDRMTVYRDGTFVEMPNHHPNWPDDFPSPALVPQPLTMQDFVIRVTPFVKIDENSYWDGSIFVWVRIDNTHWLTLEPAWFGQEDTDELTLGFGGSGFYEGDPPFDFAAAVDQQTLDVLLSDASVFTSGSSDTIEIATAGVRHYYETFMGENVPKNCRITEYTIRSVTLAAYGGTEFMVRVVSDYATTGGYFLSANGDVVLYGNTTSSGGVCTDDTKEFRFMGDGNEQYHIVSVGTGGGGVGLTPVESPAQIEEQPAAPYIEMTETDSLYFSNLDIIPEFSDINEGGATYNPQENSLTVVVIKSTGTTTGAIEGPTLRFVVDLSGTGSVLEREYQPQPDSPFFNQVREDNGELAAMSDARLVEVARAIYAVMLELPGYSADGA